MSALQFDLFGNFSVPAKKVPVKAHERTIHGVEKPKPRVARKKRVHGGRTERDRVLDALASNREGYLAGVRALAIECARALGEITIDDVRERMAEVGYPMPSDVGADERCFGTLLRCKEFVAVGQRPTTRLEWAARVGKARSNVTVYRLRES